MGIRIIRKIVKSKEGQAVVELAITLPILILILCAIIDFGWLFTNQNVIDHCSREAARYGIVHSTGTGAVIDITDYAMSIVPANIRNSIIVSVLFTNISDPRQGDVTVKVNGNIKVLTPVVGVFTQGQTISLSSTCTMKVE